MKIISENVFDKINSRKLENGWFWNGINEVYLGKIE
jgi:hypothetical protein